MTGERDKLLAELNAIDAQLTAAGDPNLVALAGRGAITLTLYRRLARLLKASKELVRFSIEEMENESP